MWISFWLEHKHSTIYDAQVYVYVLVAHICKSKSLYFGQCVENRFNDAKVKRIESITQNENPNWKSLTLSWKSIFCRFRCFKLIEINVDISHFSSLFLSFFVSLSFAINSICKYIMECESLSLTFCLKNLMILLCIHFVGF